MHQLNIMLSGWIGQSSFHDWQPLLDHSSPASNRDRFSSRRGHTSLDACKHLVARVREGGGDGVVSIMRHFHRTSLISPPASPSHAPTTPADSPSYSPPF